MEALDPDRRLLNYHARRLSRPAAEVMGRLSHMGSGRDDVWPLPSVPMKTAGEMQPGVSAAHGPIRYELVAIDPATRIEWRFTNELLQGRYEYVVTPDGTGAIVENVIDGRVSGDLLTVWPEGLGRFHDWVLEGVFDALDREPAPWFDLGQAAKIR
jgi:hypothetical protein